MSERDDIDGADDGRLPQQVPRIVVPVHRLARHVRVQLEVVDGVLRWDVPSTLLGVVPIGVRHIAIPVADVQSLHVHRAVRPFNLAVGVLCIVMPLVLGLWWIAIPMVVFGAWLVLVSLGPRLDVVTQTGAKDHASVCFSHQLDAELYMAAVDRPGRAGTQRALIAGSSRPGACRRPVRQPTRAAGSWKTSSRVIRPSGCGSKRSECRSLSSKAVRLSTTTSPVSPPRTRSVFPTERGTGLRDTPQVSYRLEA